MGEMSTETTASPVLHWQQTGLTSAEATTGCAAMIATAHGVMYWVVGSIIPGRMDGCRSFWAYRSTNNGNRWVPVAEGGEHRTRAAAYEQCERDLAQVLADREKVAVKPKYVVTDHQKADAADGRGVAKAMRSDYANAAGSALDRALRPAPAPGPLAPYVAAVERAVEDLRKRAGEVPRALVELTPAEFDQMIDRAELPELFALDNSLVDRIVKRAKYDALKQMLAVLDGWVEGARENHEAMGHRAEPVGSECWRVFAPDDIRRMVNDAAREVGTREPYRPEAAS